MSSTEFSVFLVQFDNPTYSLVGIALGGVIVTLFYLSFKRLRIAQKKLELVEWRKLRRIIRFLNISTKASLVVALSFLLAMPYFPTTIQVLVDQATDEQLSEYSIAAVLVMDVSYSMNLSDLKPTRFEASRLISETLISQMNAKDFLGFLSFANQTYDPVFPTTNRTMVKEKIDNQTLHPSTAIGDALEAAMGILDTFPIEARAIVLLSDGKSNTGINVTSAIDAAVTLKIPIFTVSLGTYGFESDPLALRNISEKTGGKFFEMRNEDIENLASSILQISHEVKVTTLKATHDRLTILAKDYQTANIVFSTALVASLFLMWITGV